MARSYQPVNANSHDRRTRKVAKRFIPQGVWESHRLAIFRLYHDFGLTEIIECMSKEHHFVASPKQYKNQFARWQLRKNMNLSDAAHLLRLIQDAERSGFDRRVLFFGKERTRKDISMYLKKTTLADTEDDLLNSIDSEDATPDYITFKDRILPGGSEDDSEMSQVIATIGPSNNVEHPDTELPSFPDNVHTGLDNDVDHSYVLVDQVLHPDALPRTQDVFLPADESVRFESAPSAFPNMANYTNYSRDFDNFQSWNPFVAAFQPLEIHSDPSNIPMDLATFHEIMSATPVAVEHGERSSKQPVHPDLSQLIEEMLGSDQEYSNTKEHSCARTFLRHCCEASIYLGQEDYPQEFERALVHAGEAYDLLLRTEITESLTVLNNLLALFDSYGRKPLAIQILERARRAAVKCLGGQDPVTITILFMASIPEQAAGTRPDYNIQILRSVHVSLARFAGSDSQLALTAKYNLAWALTEMKQYEEAREILMHLQAPCERVFGPYQLQTIGCIATLARVYLCTKQEISAECLIRETVAARLEKCFSDSHPYFWEAKNREALFLLKLARMDQAHQKKKKQEEKAEAILRQVLVWRSKVLGENNPRTNMTFRALRRLLLRQERQDEAENLHQWCEIAVQSQ